MSGGHSHGAGENADTRRLAAALALVVGFMVVEVVVGILADSLALLVGLLLNALAGWWWADPAAALVIAALAAKEGVESWRGESCDCC